MIGCLTYDYFTPSLLESLDIVMIGVRLNAHSCAMAG